jgi:hypothetical protein
MLLGGAVSGRSQLLGQEQWCHVDRTVQDSCRQCGCYRLVLGLAGLVGVIVSAKLRIVRRWLSFFIDA